MQARLLGTLAHFFAWREPFIFPQMVSAALLYDNFQLFTWLVQWAFVAEQQGSFIDKSLHWFQHGIFLCSCNARRNVWPIFLISTGFYCVSCRPLWSFLFFEVPRDDVRARVSWNPTISRSERMGRSADWLWDVLMFSFFKNRPIQLTYSHSRSQGVLLNCLRH